MTTDVRTLLHDAADAPIRAPDLDHARQSARSRRRRQRGVGALVAVVVIALVTGFVAIGGDDGDNARVAIAPRQTGSEIPDGWKTITADPGITIFAPSEWKVLPPDTTPIGAPVLSLDNLPVGADDVLAACTMGRTPTTAPDAVGSLINMWEFPAGSTEVPGTNNDTVQVVDRPTSFAGALTPGPGDCPGADSGQIAFRDAGRVFLVRAVIVFPSDTDREERLALVGQVLDTLRIDPLETVTTNTLPVTTTLPPATATTASPFVPTTADEQQIRDLFVAWLRNHPDDETRAIIEDGDALLDVIHQGLAQHSPEDLTKYSGTVQAVRMLDADHAEVEYTLLFDGHPQFGLRTGVAVRIDGQWRVSRATECALLSLGGLSCPA